MPELPEVETVRRMLEQHVVGRTVRRATVSRHKLRDRVPREVPRLVRGRRIEGVGRHGKYLLIRLDGDRTLLSHLGMSGRWLFSTAPTRERLPHVHARFAFEDGAELRFQDPRRFGMLRVVANGALARDPSLALLGPDPVADPPTGAVLERLASGARVNMKSFLLDQRRIAGIGNIYASEILHRAGVHPATRAGALRAEAWERVALETRAVLGEAIERFGTTFSMYRTLWNEPGSYGERLRVYDRAGRPCGNCGTTIRRVVQGARSTFYCPACQSAGGRSKRVALPARARARVRAPRGSAR